MDFRRWLWFSPDHGNCSNVIVRKGPAWCFSNGWHSHVAWGSGLAVMGLLLVKKSWGFPWQVVSTCLLCGYVVRGGCHYCSSRSGLALSRLLLRAISQSVSQAILSPSHPGGPPKSQAPSLPSSFQLSWGDKINNMDRKQCTTEYNYMLKLLGTFK